ncbi:MAG: VTT domain-containing protein, partial [Actinocatenispora sp.]
MSVILLAAPATGGGLAGTVADWATKIMDVLGSPGAGLANALDSIIPVLPSEVILPLAGFAASRGTINLYAALVWTTIGSIVGSLAMYYIGAAFGRERVLGWAAKIPLVKVSEIERTEAWFRRHGPITVFLGRMVPVFRSLISIPAGVERMRLTTFILYTALGSAIWNTIFVMAGYLLGANWTKVEEYGRIFSKIIIGLIVLAVVYFVVSRLLRRRREAAGRDATDADPADREGPGRDGPGWDGPGRDATGGNAADRDAVAVPYPQGPDAPAPGSSQPGAPGMRDAGPGDPDVSNGNGAWLAGLRSDAPWGQEPVGRSLGGDGPATPAGRPLGGDGPVTPAGWPLGDG